MTKPFVFLILFPCQCRCEDAEAFEVQDGGKSTGIFTKYLNAHILQSEKVTHVLEKVSEGKFLKTRLWFWFLRTWYIFSVWVDMLKKLSHKCIADIKIISVSDLSINLRQNYSKHKEYKKNCSFNFYFFNFDCSCILRANRFVGNGLFLSSCYWWTTDQLYNCWRLFLVLFTQDL